MGWCAWLLYRARDDDGREKRVMMAAGCFAGCGPTTYENSMRELNDDQWGIINVGNYGS